jgi:hypothetical protein
MKWCAWLLAGILACGGSTASLGEGGAGGDGSTVSESGSGSGSGDSGSSGGSNSSGSGSSSGGVFDAGATCQGLLDQINHLRPGAKACCPSCNHTPCAFQVEDVCCPLTVDTQSSSAVTQFGDAVKQFKLDKCLVACPAIVCPVAPSGVCDLNTALCH